MREFRVVLFVLLLFQWSCQTETPSGNEIVFGDVIGMYDGECAEYTGSTSELLNREDATLSVFAFSTDSAGIKVSCDRIEDQNLPVKSASASQIVFEQIDSDSKITMTYIAQHDSISIVKTMEGKSENLIFTGKRS